MINATNTVYIQCTKLMEQTNKHKQCSFQKHISLLPGFERRLRPLSKTGHLPLQKIEIANESRQDFFSSGDFLISLISHFFFPALSASQLLEVALLFVNNRHQLPHLRRNFFSLATETCLWNHCKKRCDFKGKDGSMEMKPEISSWW